MDRADSDSAPRIGHDPFDEGVAEWVARQDEASASDEEPSPDASLPGVAASDGEAQALLAHSLPTDLPAAVAGIERGRGMDGPRRSPPPKLRMEVDGPAAATGRQAAAPGQHEAPMPPPLVSIGDVLEAEDRRADASFSFPNDFRWGISTAANAVEGHNLDSEWWDWEQRPGHIKRGHTSGVALDWWNDAERDFDLAASMGLNALRLSVEWARVEPGPGVFDEPVLERYAEMLQALRARDIEPMVTLHHFSNPLWVAEAGGWRSRKIPGLFARYARHAVEALAGHCDLWCTLNDPNLYAYLAYSEGAFPPGISDPTAAIDALRLLIEAHGEAYDEIHSVQSQARVGLSHHVRPLLPADPHDRADRRAVERAHRAYNLAIVEALRNGRWVSPLGNGVAPRLKGKLDWLGISYYGRDLVQSDGNRRSLLARCIPGRGPDPLEGGLGEFYPDGLFEAIKRLSRLKVPIYITENGIPDDKGSLRPRYIVAHLYQVWRALQKSYPVVGYYHRTLVDSFEWSDGWTLRFGLHSLDPGSSSREPRRSAQLVRDIVSSGAITSDVIDQYAPQLRGVMLPEPAPDA